MDNRNSCWHFRGYLPHYDRSELIQAITFRLYDAVPDELIRQWKDELRWLQGLPASDPREIELARRIARYEDSGKGSCYLRDDRIACLTENALLYFHDIRYNLIVWCIMPNHVHALIETYDRFPLAGVLHSWKSYISQKANLMLGRSGPFWFRDYHDRYVRNEDHFNRVMNYIEQNPVLARLVGSAKDWRYGSARRHET